MNVRIAVTFCILLFACKPSFAQQADPNVSLNKTLKKYKNMKAEGITLIVVGGALMITGGIIEANQIGESIDPFGQGGQEQDEYNPAGSILIAAGAVMVGGGIPLAIIGSKKYKKYRDNPEVISLGIKSTHRSTGLSLTYRF